MVKSAHDCSEGGIAITLAECCVAGTIGAEVHLEGELPAHVAMFSETQSRVVLSVAEADAERLVEICLQHGVPYGVVGTVGGERLTLCGMAEVPVAQLARAYEPSLERLVHGDAPLTEELYEG
ncbi:MAG: hypothetical protein C0418_01990 [Coriobacteriaceae bacterium]|nr:hypothetical protein [Coriobacteriaceae bacterium]